MRDGPVWLDSAAVVGHRAERAFELERAERPAIERVKFGESVRIQRAATAGDDDAIAMPNMPVAASRATIEKVKVAPRRE